MGGAVLLLTGLGALAARHVRPADAGDTTPGPRQIIMGQRLTEAVPPGLAGRTRIDVPEAEARTSLTALVGRELPLLRVAGGRYQGDGSPVSLWVGDALSADAARGLATSIQAGGVAPLPDGRRVSAFARRGRLFVLAASPIVLPEALASLSPPAPGAVEAQDARVNPSEVESHGTD